VTAWALPEEVVGAAVGAASEVDDDVSSLPDADVDDEDDVLLDAGVLGVADDAVAAWLDASSPVMPPTTPSPPMAAATATWRRRRMASSRDAGEFLRCSGLIAAAPPPPP
jgi:hypothetical protein